MFKFFFFASKYPLVPTSLVEKTILFPIEWAWCPCGKSNDHRYMGLILGSQFLSIPFIYISNLMPVLYCFEFCAFIVRFEIRKYKSSNHVPLY